ncbi:MAG: helix-turn-helix domain-containing protein [Lachnospiraceae bacterium]|jgi:AraC-like DNA-binding protein
MHKLYKSYHPVTATPYQCTEDYMEFAPCEALKPYIRCFWGSRRAATRAENGAGEMDIVIPDTCMDIIFHVDFTHNHISSSFFGIDDRTFAVPYDGEKNIFFVFAVRFYPWGAALFAEESLRETKNAFFDADCHFSTVKREMERYLFDVSDICQLIPVAEKILLNRLNERHQNQTVFQAVARILEKRGNLSAAALGQEIFVSSRQLQRLFLEYIGVAPKSLASMVRYQYIWNELLQDKNFNKADAALRYGYTDQAHLCHDFKKYHSMNMEEARQYAVRGFTKI